MANWQFRLQELADTERRIAAARKLMAQNKLERAMAQGNPAAPPTLADWLNLELRRLEILHTPAVPEPGS